MILHNQRVTMLRLPPPNLWSHHHLIN